jgi:uncharacterized protein (DUF2147 family)
MPLERQILRSAALAVGLLAAAPAFAASDPSGVWLNDTGRGAIEIKPCGASLCGNVVWVKDPTSDAKGCGRQIIGDLVSTGGGVWGGDNAWIYSPEKKKNYNVEVTPLSDGTLKVKGYAGLSFLSKTMIWTKAPADLQRCSTQEAAATPAPAAPDTKGATPPAATTAPGASTVPSNEAVAPPPASNSESADNAGGKKEGIDLEGLAGEFGDVLKRDDKGNCKLDLPWVKVDFHCDKSKDEAAAAK